jgi:hypothetical protein
MRVKKKRQGKRGKRIFFKKTDIRELIKREKKFGRYGNLSRKRIKIQ